VEQLKRHGIFQVARTIAADHSMGPHGPEESPSALPLWRCRSGAGG
jgi:hypothetical protein